MYEIVRVNIMIIPAERKNLSNAKRKYLLNQTCRSYDQRDQRNKGISFELLVF